MTHIDMRTFLCRDDNFGLLIHDHKTGATAAIDAPDANAIEKELRKLGRQLTHILVTHHHMDHIEGILQLKDLFGCKVIGPKAEADVIPGLDVMVSGGEKFTWAGREVEVWDCPGHSKGHIVFHMPEEFSVFAGDVLFSIGCGRVGEAAMEQMYQAVSKFKPLPPHTYLYCGHEYTLANCNFALTIDPDNRHLHARYIEVQKLLSEGRLTCPSTMGDEFKANPYLRLDDKAIRHTLGMEGASDLEVFTAIRTRKNNFK
jgi:hydroxyacylglutathione hydrolase